MTKTQAASGVRRGDAAASAAMSENAGNGGVRAEVFQYVQSGAEILSTISAVDRSRWCQAGWFCGTARLPLWGPYPPAVVG